jgi:hypothetical protein
MAKCHAIDVSAKNKRVPELIAFAFWHPEIEFHLHDPYYALMMQFYT